MNLDNKDWAVLLWIISWIPLFGSIGKHGTEYWFFEIAWMLVFGSYCFIVFKLNKRIEVLHNGSN